MPQPLNASHAAATRRWPMPPSHRSGRVVLLGRERRDVLGPEACMGVRREPEFLEIGHTEKRPESIPDDALRLQQITFEKAADDHHDASWKNPSPMLSSRAMAMQIGRG